MSHRKVYSQGNIPFSWEDSPGVSKRIHQEGFSKSKDGGLNGLNITSPTSMPLTTTFHPLDKEVTTKVLAHELMKIPLPPCPKPKMDYPQRSLLVKGFKWWQEDPFFAAYKECTKSNEKHFKSFNSSELNKRSSGAKLRKGKIIFSCKSSCDVKEDNFVRLSNLPLCSKRSKK